MTQSGGLRSAALWLHIYYYTERGAAKGKNSGAAKYIKKYICYNI